MAVSGIPGSGAYVPTQRLQAERAAAAAQSRADRLAGESEQARGEARRLDQQAQRLDQASDQARGEAVQARKDAGGSAGSDTVGRQAPLQLYLSVGGAGGGPGSRLQTSA